MLPLNFTGTKILQGRILLLITYWNVKDHLIKLYKVLNSKRRENSLRGSQDLIWYMLC